MPLRRFGMIVVLLGPLVVGCGAVATALLSPPQDGRPAGRSGSFSADDGTQGDSAADMTGDPAPGEEEPVGSPIGSDNETGTDAGQPGMDSASLPEEPIDSPTDPPLIIDTPGGQPVDPFLPVPPESVDPIDTSVLDPLAVTFGDPALIGDLMPFLLDGFLIDALDPAGTTTSSGIAASFSDLELLCRDRDLPETFCRRRFSR